MNLSESVSSREISPLQDRHLTSLHRERLVHVFHQLERRGLFNSFHEAMPVGKRAAIVRQENGRAPAIRTMEVAVRLGP